MRDRPDLDTVMRISNTATVSAHDCILCGALVYRVHVDPDFRATARFDSRHEAPTVTTVSPADERRRLMRLLSDLPTHERSHRRTEPVAA